MLFPLCLQVSYQLLALYITLQPSIRASALRSTPVWAITEASNLPPEAIAAACSLTPIIGTAAAAAAGMPAQPPPQPLEGFGSALPMDPLSPHSHISKASLQSIDLSSPQCSMELGNIASSVSLGQHYQQGLVMAGVPMDATSPQGGPLVPLSGVLDVGGSDSTATGPGTPPPLEQALAMMGQEGGEGRAAAGSSSGAGPESGGTAGAGQVDASSAGVVHPHMATIRTSGAGMVSAGPGTPSKPGTPSRAPGTPDGSVRNVGEQPGTSPHVLLNHLSASAHHHRHSSLGGAPSSGYLPGRMSLNVSQSGTGANTPASGLLSKDPSVHSLSMVNMEEASAQDFPPEALFMVWAHSEQHMQWKSLQWVVQFLIPELLDAAKVGGFCLLGL